ncbi:hypothetical protein NKJ66_26925 [Mesorhizobium sp. M0078]|uniref:hypothetical protein n=1 Tax=Mesorhizobium sp. M0078 TaxID=2956871 RepID=UPI003336492C
MAKKDGEQLLAFAAQVVGSGFPGRYQIEIGANDGMVCKRSDVSAPLDRASIFFRCPGKG